MSKLMDVFANVVLLIRCEVSYSYTIDQIITNFKS